MPTKTDTDGTVHKAKFLYWEDQFGVRHEPGSKLEMDRDYILYAVWGYPDDEGITTGYLQFAKGVVGPGNEFSFNLNLKDTNGNVLVDSFPYEIYDANNTLVSANGATIKNGGTFKLRNAWYIKVLDLPDGTVCTVTEMVNSNYAADNQSVSSTIVKGNPSYLAIKNTYKPKITYNPNYPIGSTPDPVSEYKVYGEGYQIKGAADHRFAVTGHSFTGWNTAADGSGSSYAAVSTYFGNDDLTLYAQWSAKEYTITWVDGFGNTLKTEALEYGATVSEMTDPAKEGHTFIGWDKTAPATMPAENLTITAQWKINEYTITWVDGDGNTLKAEKYAYGVVPSYTGVTPTKSSTAEFSFMFNDKRSPEIVAVTGDATYTAQFDKTELERTTTLTIRVANCDVEKDPEQSYLFSVVDTDGVKLTVTVLENGAVTIHGVTVGAKYTVAMDAPWSWRYREEAEKASQTKAIAADAAKNVFIFEVDRVNDLWLDGNGLFATIKRFFKDMIAKFTKEYAELTPDQQDARDIREMKDMFDKIQKAFAEALVEASDNFQATEAQKNTTEEGGVAMSIREVVGESGETYGKGVYLDSNKLTNVPEDQRKATVIGLFRKLGGKKVIAYDQNGDAVEISIAEGSRRYKKSNGKSVPVNNHITSFLNNPIKQEALILADELIAVSHFEGKEDAVHAHDWLDNDGKNQWDVWKVFIQEKNNSVWEATLKVANTVDGEKVLYEIYPIEMVEAARKPGTSTTNNRVAQPEAEVKKNSDRDSKGKDNHIATDYIVFNSNQFKKTDNKTPTSDPDIRYSYRGVNKDGIEVYETSEATMKLTWADRVSQYEKMLSTNFVGRTARFKRNGHIYYAQFDPNSAGKVLYGEKGMSKDGKKAIIRAGADGDIFDLVENARYDHSAKDKKNHRAKDGFTDYFDYFYKTVQIDGKVFDININVKKQYGSKHGYTYTIKVADNKTMKASPALAVTQPSKVQGTPSATKITQPTSKVNSQNSGTNSERGEDTSNRALLANAFEGLSKSSAEYKMIQDYKEQIKVLNLLDEQLSDLNAEIREIRFTKGKYDAEKLRKLEEKAERIARDINKQDKVLIRMEASEPLRKIIAFERKKAAQKTKEHIAEIQQNKKLRAEQTELRHKIRKTVRDLDKILKKGNKKRNVKITSLVTDERMCRL